MRSPPSEAQGPVSRSVEKRSPSNKGEEGDGERHPAWDNHAHVGPRRELAAGHRSRPKASPAPTTTSASHTFGTLGSIC